MSSSLLEAAFAHHVWATSRVIDACLDLRVEELAPTAGLDSAALHSMTCHN